MYFDFEDYRPDTPTIARPLTRLEAVLLTSLVHLLAVILILVWPELPFVKAAEARQQQLQEELRRLELERQRESATFVFVQPKIDMQALKPPPRHELSDIDRRARTVERAPNPTNSMPFSRGNTSERIEAARPVETRRTARPQPGPIRRQPKAPDPARKGLTLPDAPNATEPKSADASRRTDRCHRRRDPQRAEIRAKDGFVNLQGGAEQDFAPSIQFGTKGSSSTRGSAAIPRRSGALVSFLCGDVDARARRSRSSSTRTGASPS